MAKLKFGLVGGGHGAFIGQVHRMAAELDGLAELVCGAFSADPVQSPRDWAESDGRISAADRCGQCVDLHRSLANYSSNFFMMTSSSNYLFRRR